MGWSNSVADALAKHMPKGHMKGQGGAGGMLIVLAIVVIIAAVTFLLGGTMLEKLVEITGSLVTTPSANFNQVLADSYSLLTTASGFAVLIVVGIVIAAVLALLVGIYLQFAGGFGGTAR